MTAATPPPQFARALLEAQALPVGDAYQLPDSPLRFPDGGHYRLEISGVERLSVFEALLAEADRRNLFIHRVIAFVAGSTLIDDAELRAFAELGRERSTEVIVVPGPRAAWDSGRQVVTPEGKLAGTRIRGCDNFYFTLRDYLRCIELGFRGLLVWDEGMLQVLAQARAAGQIPADTVLKVSVFTGHGNPAAIRVLEQLGADSLNPVADLSRPMLSAIRSAVKLPLDIYACVYDSFGGINRFWEAGELARVAAPCYFKIEPGEAEAAMYGGWTDPAYHQMHVREKVRYAEVLNQLIASETGGLVRPSPKNGTTTGVPAPPASAAGAILRD